LQVFVAYTWQHSMDNGSGFENSGFGGGGFGGFGGLRGINPFNQRLYDYGPSNYDARHRLVITYTYEIPPIHHFSNWAAQRFFEGWRMNGITTFQTGFPLDVIDGGARSLTCSSDFAFYQCPDIPNVVSAPQYANPEMDSFVNKVKNPNATNTK